MRSTHRGWERHHDLSRKRSEGRARDGVGVWADAKEAAAETVACSPEHANERSLDSVKPENYLTICTSITFSRIPFHDVSV
jgi:hypothetical protein